MSERNNQKTKKSGRRSKRTQQAVAKGLSGWSPDRPKPATRPSRPITRPRSFSGDEPDEALAHIDSLMSTSLGKAWLAGDELGTTTLLVDTEEVEVEGVVAPLPRRKVIAAGHDGAGLPSMSREVEFKAGAMLGIARMFLWLWGYLRYKWLNISDRLRGRGSIRTRAVRLRETFENLGATFVKLGQQLAIRADILPFEYCEELAKMLDKVPPFPSEQAIEIIERNTGRPIIKTFAIFDPTPIGSASLSCVYQAILKNGDKVAVKVRRPGIDKKLAGDLRALGWLMNVSEWLSFVRPGMTKNLKHELHTMLTEELDFNREARYTALFGREAAAKKQSYVTAPRVYFEISSEEVLVTEYINGVFLSEILSAVDRQDEATLAQLAARNIDPKTVAQRLTLAFNWETYENLLFHADPHPANIVVKPGNSIVFIDFGSCGHFSSKAKRLWRQFHYHLARADVTGMVDIAISLLEPLPPIDIDEYTKQIEALYWDWLYAIRSPEAQWWEKASGVMWMKFIGISRDYQVPINLDTLRGLRVTFLFDTVIFRLYKDLDLSTEYRRYHKQAGSRARKRVKKAIRKRMTDGLSNQDYLQLEETMRMGNQIASRMQHFLDTPQHNFGAVIDKFAYGMAVGLQVTFFGIAMHLAVVVGFVAYTLATGGTIDTFWHAFVRIVTHPLYRIIPLAIVLILIRKVLVRFTDYDVNG